MYFVPDMFKYRLIKTCFYHDVALRFVYRTRSPFGHAGNLQILNNNHRVFLLIESPPTVQLTALPFDQAARKAPPTGTIQAGTAGGATGQCTGQAALVWYAANSRRYSVWASGIPIFTAKVEVTDTLTATTRGISAYQCDPARRKIHDVHVRTPSALTEEALKRIGGLYAIEAGIRGMPAELRLAERQLKKKPLLNALESWLREKVKTLSRYSELAKAFAYALNQWSALKYYAEDGWAEADNNIAENALRMVSLCRKNWLFFTEVSAVLSCTA